MRRDGVEPPAQLAEVAFECLGVGKEEFAVLGEGGGARCPGPQVHAELLLEPAHRPAQALGSDAELLGGPRQAVLMLERYEVRERLRVHVRVPPDAMR